MFIRWPDIENVKTAETQSTASWTKAHNIKGWAVSEKLDGANISIAFFPDGTNEIGRRNGILLKGEAFYNIYENLNKINPLVDVMKGFKWGDGISQVTFYGEYFGPTIMNRVNYGNENQFRFFEMSLMDASGNVYYFSVEDFRKFFYDNHIEELLVPLMDTVDTFEEACAYKNNGRTVFWDGDDSRSTMEGIVIMPIHEPPVSKHGNFMFKSKSEEFKEVAGKKRREPTSEEKGIKELVEKGREEFKRYCTESRMYSVFSKLGVPEGKKDIGKFVGEFLSDAKKDFLKDCPEYRDAPDGVLRRIMNVGPAAYEVFLSVQSRQSVGS